MKISLPVSTLRQLKGAPISVLLSMIFVHQAVSERWIIQTTGYSQNVVRGALNYLKECNFVQRNGRFEAWILCDGVLQLPLVMDLEAGESENDSRFSSAATATTPLNLNSLSPIESTSSSSNRRESLNDSRSNPALNIEVLAELHALGIMGKKAQELAGLAWVTIPYAQAHVKKVKEEGNKLGLAITRMEQGDPIDTRTPAQKMREGWGLSAEEPEEDEEEDAPESNQPSGQAAHLANSDFYSHLASAKRLRNKEKR